jgi:hypothetical protein
MLQDKTFTVLLEVLFSLPLDKFSVTENILLDLEELTQKLFEGTTVDVTQFTN